MRAMQIINELEPVARSVYCAAQSAMSSDPACLDTNIAIRTLLFTRTGVHCWGGGGLVADSAFDAERSEIDHKIGRLLYAVAGMRSSSACSAS
jgi:para-aminobenzoate synthetase component 1